MDGNGYFTKADLEREILQLDNQSSITSTFFGVGHWRYVVIANGTTVSINEVMKNYVETYSKNVVITRWEAGDVIARHVVLDEIMTHIRTWKKR